MDSWRRSALRCQYILDIMRSFVHSWALQVLNTYSSRALLNTGGLKICFKSNTCLHSFLNQNQNPLCWHSLGYTESRIMPGRMKSVISSENKQACKAIKDHKQEEEKQGQDFYLSLNHGRVQRRKQWKIFLFLCFFLAWQDEWVSAAPLKSDYLTFRNEFAKETVAYHEAADRMLPRPPTPKNPG